MGDIFELSTQAERPQFRVDGETYHFRLRDDMSLKESAFMIWAGKRIDKLQQELQDTEEWDEQKADELEELLDRCAKIMTHDLPDEIRQKLNDMQKTQLLQAFLETVGLTETGSREDNPLE